MSDGIGIFECAFTVQSPKPSANRNRCLAALQDARVATSPHPLAFAFGTGDDRPRATESGIAGRHRSSGFQYWALRSDGDFYCLDQFLEDTDQPSVVYIDARIHRVTEALMLAASLYRNLGVDREQKVGVRIVHTGLRGRRLRFSVATTFVDRTSDQAEARWERITRLHNLNEDLIGLVKECCEDLFERFELASVDDESYERLIYAFQAGKIAWPGL